MTIPLAGTAAVVSGGTSGIGLAIADALHAAGSRVAVWSRTAGRREAGADRFYEVPCDTANPDEVAAAMQATRSALGRIGCCVTAAGVNAVRPFQTTSLADLRHTLAVNLEGTFLVLQAAAREMAASGGGSLVAISSIAGVRGQATTADYAASKGAVRALVRSIADELAGMAVRANVITPGYIETPMLAPHLESERFVRSVTGRVPMGRIGTPVELGPLAVFLAGPASRGITGAEFLVDGGYTVA